MLTDEEFYEAFDEAGFLTPASWTPSADAGGGPAQTEQVEYLAPNGDALGGGASFTDYAIKYPATKFPGLRRGETLVVDGKGTFKVREGPVSTDLDAGELKAGLEKVS